MGRRTLYGLRKQTVEPLPGIIKSGMAFRQFLPRAPGDLRGVGVGDDALEHPPYGGAQGLRGEQKTLRRS